MSYTLTLTEIEARRVLEVLRQVPLDVLNAYGLAELVAKVTLELDEQVDDEVPYINSMGSVPRTNTVNSASDSDLILDPNPTAILEAISTMDSALSSDSGSSSSSSDSGSSSSDSSSSSSPDSSSSY